MPLVFFVESNEVIILDMSLLLKNLKSNTANSLVDVKADLIVIMVGCTSYFLIALTSGSSQRRFEHYHLSMFNPLVMSWKYMLKRYAISSFLETTFSFFNSIILSWRFGIWLVKEGFQNFQKFFEDEPCGICF